MSGLSKEKREANFERSLKIVDAVSIIYPMQSLSELGDRKSPEKLAAISPVKRNPAIRASDSKEIEVDLDLVANVGIQLVNATRCNDDSIACSEGCLTDRQAGIAMKAFAKGAEGHNPYVKKLLSDFFERKILPNVDKENADEVKAAISNFIENISEYSRPSGIIKMLIDKNFNSESLEKQFEANLQNLNDAYSSVSPEDQAKAEYLNAKSKALENLTKDYQTNLSFVNIIDKIDRENLNISGKDLRGLSNQLKKEIKKNSRAGVYDGFKEAYDILAEVNPIMDTCKVCPDVAPCMGKNGCTVGKYNSSHSVQIRSVEGACRNLAELFDWDKEKYKKPSKKQLQQFEGLKVLVVGSGAAGLSAAQTMGMAGIAVDVAEVSESSGGLFKFGIPEWKVNGKRINRTVENIESLGTVNFINNTWVGNSAPYDKSKNHLTIEQAQQNYDLIIVADGVSSSPRMSNGVVVKANSEILEKIKNNQSFNISDVDSCEKVNIKPEQVDGVVEAMDFLPEQNRADQRGGVSAMNFADQRVIVAGGSDTADDCGATVTRQKRQASINGSKDISSFVSFDRNARPTLSLYDINTHMDRNGASKFYSEQEAILSGVADENYRKYGREANIFVVDENNKLVGVVAEERKWIDSKHNQLDKYDLTKEEYDNATEVVSREFYPCDKFIKAFGYERGKSLLLVDLEVSDAKGYKQRPNTSGVTGKQGVLVSGDQIPGGDNLWVRALKTGTVAGLSAIKILKKIRESGISREQLWGKEGEELWKNEAMTLKEPPLRKRNDPTKMYVGDQLVTVGSEIRFG